MSKGYSLHPFALRQDMYIGSEWRKQEGEWNSMRDICWRKLSCKESSCPLLLWPLLERREWRNKSRKEKDRRQILVFIVETSGQSAISLNAFVPELIMEGNLGGTLWCKCVPEETDSWTSRLSAVCPLWVSTLHLQHRDTQGAQRSSGYFSWKLECYCT